MITYSKMRISGTLLSICALMLIPSTGRASIQTIRDSNTEIWGSVGVSLFNYQELISAPDIPDSEHGWNPSLAVGMDYMSLKGNWYFASEFSDTFGNAHYNGSALDFATGNYDIPVQGKTKESMDSLDAKFGKGVVLGRSIMLTPYAEVGYHHWGRKLNSFQTEDYDNLDVLGGLMLQGTPIRRLILTGYVSAGPTLAPTMKTSGQTYSLGSTAMYKLGAKIAYDVTKQVELFTALDYDAFRYTQSPAQADGSFEPTSKTEDTTLRVGVGYHFR
jgi:hypothetical protein